MNEKSQTIAKYLFKDTEEWFPPRKINYINDIFLSNLNSLKNIMLDLLWSIQLIATNSCVERHRDYSVIHIDEHQINLSEPKEPLKLIDWISIKKNTCNKLAGNLSVLNPSKKAKALEKAGVGIPCKTEVETTFLQWSLKLFIYKYYISY